MEENKKEQQAEERKLSELQADLLSCRQSHEVSENIGLIRLSVAVADYEDEYIEWCRAGEELDRELDSLRNYGAVDCRISLAEYSEPELDIKNISKIKTSVLYIPHNENFYFRTIDEAVTTLLKYCIEKSLPTPTQIDYVIDGYYLM